MAQSFRHREETINTQLAILLSRHGVAAESETIHQSGQQRPDVMFTLGGLRVIIEGKFSDTPDADNVVLSDAAKRVQTGICHIAVALVYPKPCELSPQPSSNRLWRHKGSVLSSFQRLEKRSGRKQRRRKSWQLCAGYGSL